MAYHLPHRFGNVSVNILDTDGQPLSDREVIVEQRAHAFSFGNIGFDFIPVPNDETDPSRSAFGGASPDRAARIADLWFDFFNVATLPFYWGAFEPQRGRPDTTRLSGRGVVRRPRLPGEGAPAGVAHAGSRLVARDADR